MLNIYPVVLQVVEGMRDVLVQVERHDKDLARQGRRAVLSILLNVKEAMGSEKGNRKVTVVQCARVCARDRRVLDGARAMRYVKGVDPLLAERLDHVTAVLVLLARRG